MIFKCIKFLSDDFEQRRRVGVEPTVGESYIRPFNGRRCLEKGAAVATEATSTTRRDNFTFNKYSLRLRLSVSCLNWCIRGRERGVEVEELNWQSGETERKDF